MYQSGGENIGPVNHSLQANGSSGRCYRARLKGELHGGYGATTDFAIQRIHRDCVTSVVAGGAPAVLRNGVAAGLFPDRKFPQT